MICIESTIELLARSQYNLDSGWDSEGMRNNRIPVGQSSRKIRDSNGHAKWVDQSLKNASVSEPRWCSFSPTS